MVHVWMSPCPCCPCTQVDVTRPRGTARARTSPTPWSRHTRGHHPVPMYLCTDVPLSPWPLRTKEHAHHRVPNGPTTLSPLMPPRPGVPRTPPRHQDPQGHSEPSCPPQGGYGGDNGATHSYPGPDDHRGPLTATKGHRGPPPSAAPRPPGPEPGAGREPRFPAALKASFVFYSRALAGIRF